MRSNEIPKKNNDSRKLIVSIFDFVTPAGCERVLYTNPLAHIYKLVYHNARSYPPDEYVIQYSPQEGVTERYYRHESDEEALEEEE